MYKLIVILTAVLCMSNTQALTIIEDDNATKRHDVCVNKIVEKMELENSGWEIVIRERSLVTSMEAYVALTSLPNTVILVLKEGLPVDADETYFAIAHELIHVRQMIRGDKFNNQLKYRKRPHEIEAFTKEAMFGKVCR